MKLYRNVIGVVFFALAVYVFVLNMTVTCFTSADRFELNYYSGDIVILNLVCVALAAAGVLFIDVRKAMSFAVRHYDITRIILLGLTAAAGLAAAFCCGLDSGVDQLRVQESVYGLTRGNYGMFMPTGYMDVYPNQYGFALIMYLGSFVFGTYNYLAVRIMNVIFLVILYRELAEVGGQIGLGKCGRLIVLLAGILFVPATLYSLFIYGNIAGLALSVLAARLMISAFIGSKHPVFCGVMSVLAVFAACLFKSNYMIFGVGIGIYCLFKTIHARMWSRMILVPALMVSLWLSSYIPALVMRSVTGYELQGGVSYMSYLAMGVQENAAGYAGGFNGFNEDTYRSLQGDKAKHSEFSAQVYSQIMSEMASSPSYLLNFFTRKQMHQWADPAYKSYWSVQSVPQHGTSEWFYRMILPGNAYPVIVFLSYFQLVVWLGAIFYVWFVKRGSSGFDEAMVMAVIFIGGFIFHTFWEAKSQYVFPFFVILFPVSAAGWKALKVWFDGRERKPLSERFKSLSGAKISWSFRFTLVSFALLTVFPLVLGLATLRPQMAQDRELYRDYLSSGYRQAHNPLDNDAYEIKGSTVSYTVEAVNKGDKTMLRDVSTGQYITAVPYAYGSGDVITLSEYRGDETQCFNLYVTNEDKLIIVYNYEYVICDRNDGLSAEFVPVGTLVWTEPNEGRTWQYRRIGQGG